MSVKFVFKNILKNTVALFGARLFGYRSVIFHVAKEPLAKQTSRSWLAAVPSVRNFRIDFYYIVRRTQTTTNF
jgi:hypothetical protein